MVLRNPAVLVYHISSKAPYNGISIECIVVQHISPIIVMSNSRMGGGSVAGLYVQITGNMLLWLLGNSVDQIYVLSSAYMYW